MTAELQRKYDYLFFSLEQKQILLGIPSFHPLYDKGGTATAPAALSVSELSAMEDAPFILPDIGTVIGERVSRFLEQNHLKFNIPAQNFESPDKRTSACRRKLCRFSG